MPFVRRLSLIFAGALAGRRCTERAGFPSSAIINSMSLKAETAVRCDQFRCRNAELKLPQGVDTGDLGIPMPGVFSLVQRDGICSLTRASSDGCRDAGATWRSRHRNQHSGPVSTSAWSGFHTRIVIALGITWNDRTGGSDAGRRAIWRAEASPRRAFSQFRRRVFQQRPISPGPCLARSGFGWLTRSDRAQGKLFLHYACAYLTATPPRAVMSVASYRCFAFSPAPASPANIPRSIRPSSELVPARYRGWTTRDQRSFWIGAASARSAPSFCATRSGSVRSRLAPGLPFTRRALSLIVFVNA